MSEKQTDRVISIGSINISKEKGTVKTPVESALLDETGIPADAHSGRWHRQLSLLGQPSVERFQAAMERTIGPGEFGENITVDGLDLNDVAVLDRFRIGQVELEITQIGKTCHGDDCAIYREVGKCVMPQEGLFARVIKAGTIHAGDVMEYLPRPFRLHVITTSDRAQGGYYKDISGPRILELTEKRFALKRWHLETGYTLLPDDPEEIGRVLDRLTALEASGETPAPLAPSGSKTGETSRETFGGLPLPGADIIFTTGGTGIGPRDFTVDAVASRADKLVPGIMDHIRLLYGAKKPNALISRSICAVKGSTIIFTLPGSVKAVEEYLTEIWKVVEHMVVMLHGIGH